MVRHVRAKQQYTLNAGILRVSYEFGVLEYFMLYAADHTFFIGWFFHVKAIKYCVPDLDMGSMDLSTFCLPCKIHAPLLLLLLNALIYVCSGSKHFNKCLLFMVLTSAFFVIQSQTQTHFFSLF